MRKKIEMQEESYTCAISCIKMILLNKNIDVSEVEIKRKCGLTMSGVTMKGIIDCLDSFGIEAKGYQCELEEIEFKEPCILLVENHGLTHYIVLMKKINSYYLCKDPDQGLVYYTLGELSSIFLKKVIIIKHQSIEKRNHQKHLIHMLLEILSWKLILKVILISAMMILLETLFSSILSVLVEEYTVNKIIPLFLILGILTIISIEMQFFVLKQTKKQEVKIVKESMDHLLSQDENFYLFTRKERMVSLIESFQQLPNYIVSMIVEGISGISMISFMLFLLYKISKNIFFILLFYLLFIILLLYIIQEVIEPMEIACLKKKQFLFQRFIDKLNHLNGYRLIHDLKMDHYYEEYLDAYVHLYQYSTLFIHFTTFLGQILLLIMIGYSFNDHLTIGEIFQVIYLTNLILTSLMKLVSLAISYPSKDHLYCKSNDLIVPTKEPLEERIQEIRIENLSFSYGKKVSILERINGRFTGHYYIEGNNGCGKSTFLKLIGNHYDSYLGHLYYNQKEIKQLDYLSTLKRVIYLDSEMMIPFENGYELFPLEWLRKVDPSLESLYNVHQSQLSKGQYQMIVFLYSIFIGFDVYLLDECFNHLDNSYLNIVLGLLEGELFQDKIVFYCDHALKKIPKTFESVIIEKKKLKGLD